MLKVQLIVVQGKPEGKTIPLTGSVFRIGRDESCQLRPSSEEVSRRHAEFAVSADSVTVRDLGSRNGTFLNGRAVTELSKLKSGDLVKVGPLTFTVSIQGAVAAASAAAAGTGGAAAAASAKSLDEVSAQEVDAWLVADNQHEVPDRPSGVFDGDTVMMGTYESGAEAKGTAEAKTQEPAPAPKAKPAAAPAPAPAAAAPPPPAPAPAPPAPAPPAPAPAVASAPTVEGMDAIPLDDTPLPARPEVSKPAPAAPKPVSSQSVGTPPKSIWDELDNMEYLPEGEGDAPQEGYSGDNEFNPDDESEEAGESGSGSSSAAAEEWVDESNPFYLAKKKAQEEAANAGKGDAKPSFKDSSEAANAILKKILDRKKSGG